MMRSLYLSRQYGVRESKDVTIEGRVQFDLLQVVIYFCLAIKSVFAFFHEIISYVSLSSLPGYDAGYATGLQAEFLFIELCIGTLSWGASKFKHFKCSMLLSVIVLVIILMPFCRKYFFVFDQC